MNELKNILEKIYGNKANLVLQGVKGIIGDIKSVENISWHKNFQLYVTYPDAFLPEKNFESLIGKISHIKGLGCSAIHVLPFLESPLVDSGFDISDFRRVRDSLGGNAAFERFLVRASEQGIRVFMDLVLNHVSSEHEWFQKAVNGEEKYRDYFVFMGEKPKLLEVKQSRTGAELPSAVYNFGGKAYELAIIFPEQAGPFPHWVAGKDNHYYYHTFYPQQIDLDWKNPDVFLEFAGIVVHWARKGLSFRLDAIPFVGKDVFHGAHQGTQDTHNIVKALSRIAKMVQPDCAFLVEAVQSTKENIAYFGKDIPEADLAYDFALMNGMWASLMTQDSQFVWRASQDAHPIPEHAQWISFLRNHDEVMVGFIKGTHRLIHDALAKHGLDFKEGYAVVGRTASFLEEDENRILNAHFLLASLPGCLGIIYGDEIGKPNDFENMRRHVKMKRDYFNDESIAEEARDVNRGYISGSDIERKKGLYAKISDVLNNRPGVIATGKAADIAMQVGAGKEVVCAGYGSMKAFVNLSNKQKKISVSGSIIFQVNKARMEPNRLVLPAYAGAWIQG